jgi:hypothetical protein
MVRNKALAFVFNYHSMLLEDRDTKIVLLIGSDTEGTNTIHTGLRSLDNVNSTGLGAALRDESIRGRASFKIRACCTPVYLYALLVAYTVSDWAPPCVLKLSADGQVLRFELVVAEKSSYWTTIIRQSWGQRSPRC